MLAQHYNAYKTRGLPFEVVFSTADKDEASFDAYYKEMAKDGGDWLAIPWADANRRKKLDSLFEVSGIPTLVIVDDQGRVVSKNARNAVSADATGDAFPWAPPAVGDLSQPERINEVPSLCVFMESATPEQQRAMTVEIERVAEKYAAQAKAKGEEPSYLFFAGKAATGAVPQIRKACGLESEGALEPVVVFLDIDDNGAFYKPVAVEITTASIEAFIKAYEDKTVERQQMRKQG